jgi:hypothetical protein
MPRNFPPVGGGGQAAGGRGRAQQSPSGKACPFAGIVRSASHRSPFTIALYGVVIYFDRFACLAGITVGIQVANV